MTGCAVNEDLNLFANGRDEGFTGIAPRKDGMFTAGTPVWGREAGVFSANMACAHPASTHPLLADWGLVQGA